MHSPSAGLVGMRATYDTHKWGSGCTQCAVGQFAGSRGQPSCKTCDWGTWTLGEEPGSSSTTRLGVVFGGRRRPQRRS